MYIRIHYYCYYNIYIYSSWTEIIQFDLKLNNSQFMDFVVVKRTFRIPSNMAKTANHISTDLHRKGAQMGLPDFKQAKKETKICSCNFPGSSIGSLNLTVNILPNDFQRVHSFCSIMFYNSNWKQNWTGCWILAHAHDRKKGLVNRGGIFQPKHPEGYSATILWVRGLPKNRWHTKNPKRQAAVFSPLRRGWCDALSVFKSLCPPSTFSTVRFRTDFPVHG